MGKSKRIFEEVRETEDVLEHLEHLEQLETELNQEIKELMHIDATKVPYEPQPLDKFLKDIKLTDEQETT